MSRPGTLGWPPIPDAGLQKGRQFQKAVLMLAQSQIAQYLVARGLTSPQCIVDCDFEVSEVSRRNRNFRVLSEHGSCYLLKQCKSPGETDTLVHEARVYGLLHQVAGESSLLHYLPRVVKYDANEKVLILELLRNARDLRELSQRSNRISNRIGVTLGRALGSLHRISGSALAPAQEIGLRNHCPWVLSIHRPSLGIFRDTSSANLQVIRIVQNTAGFGTLLDQLRESWRVDAVIHNDMKWDNCLVLRNTRSSGEPVLKIVDWEFANLGDSCWDVGAVFSAFLSSWAFSVPICGEEPAGYFLELAKHPLARMHPAIRGFWEAYREGRGLGRAESDDFVLRALRFGAARLLQAAFEQMQSSTILTGNVVCLLQLSFNILQRPREALVQLLGVSVNREVTEFRHE